MLSLSAGVPVHFALGATDMRKSFNGLIALTQRELQRDPLSGHVFAFCNRRRNLLKLLFWDGTGFWVLAKRLESGTFAWPRSAQDRPGSEDLAVILAGLDPAKVTRRGWWRLDPTGVAASL